MPYAAEKFKAYLRDHILPGCLFRWRAAILRVPDADLYAPTFQPWRGESPFRHLYNDISGHTLVSHRSAWTLYTLARQALSVEGDFLEAGVYRGGTARLLRCILESTRGSRRLHLFDTFAGMPRTNRKKDHHREKDFSDTSIEAVSAFVGHEEFIAYHKGFIPDTFKGLENATFSFVHIDVDIYQSILDCCAFIYPRMTIGGMMLFDDYGMPSCPGARAAVDQFFSDKPEVPLVLDSGQAIIFIGGHRNG